MPVITPYLFRLVLMEFLVFTFLILLFLVSLDKAAAFEKKNTFSSYFLTLAKLKSEINSFVLFTRFTYSLPRA